LPHVFDRFYRADGARGRATGGTGLGLAIARVIARRHGGDITVASEPGRGSEFTVSLSAQPEPLPS
jgi:two-component system sensor histidine kinase BaeS